MRQHKWNLGQVIGGQDGGGVEERRYLITACSIRLQTWISNSGVGGNSNNNDDVDDNSSGGGGDDDDNIKIKDEKQEQWQQN